MVNRTLFASRHSVAVDSTQTGIIAAGQGLSTHDACFELNRN
jgi:hypothetical protein